jgi:hypothetical protein
MTDPDGNPNCVTKVISFPFKSLNYLIIIKSTMQVGMGGEVPRSYYLDTKPDPTNKKTFTVSRGSKEQLEIQIKQAGAILKYTAFKLHLATHYQLKKRLFYFPVLKMGFLYGRRRSSICCVQEKRQRIDSDRFSRPDRL